MPGIGEGGGIVLAALLVLLLANLAAAQDQAAVDSLEAALPDAGGEARISVLCDLAGRLWYRDPDRALSLAQEALALADSLGLPAGRARALNRIGIAHWASGDLAAALDATHRAEEIYTEIGDRESAASCLSNLGMLYGAVGAHDEALEHYLDALVVVEELGMPRCRIDNNIGSLYEKLGDDLQARVYYERAVAAGEAENDPIGRSAALVNLGYHYEDEGDYDRALAYALQALTLARELDDKSRQGDVLTVMGSCYFGLGDVERALDSLRRALALHEEVPNPLGVLECLTLLGDYQAEAGDTDAALADLRRALALGREIGARAELARIHGILARAFRARGQVDSAYVHLDRHAALRDSVYSEEMHQRVSDLEIRYATEKHQRAIELLEKDRELQELEITRQKQTRLYLYLLLAALVALAAVLYSRDRLRVKSHRQLLAAHEQIAGQNEQLERVNARQAQLLGDLEHANATKDRFFSLVAEDLRGSIDTLQSGTRLLTLYLENLKRDEVVAAVLELQSHARSLFALLENLLQWARLNLDGVTLSPVDLELAALADECLDALAAAAAAKELTIRNEIPDGLVVRSDRALVAVVLRNLVSNAIKFSRPSGVVVLGAGVRDGRVEVSVRDQGVGIERERLSDLMRVDRRVSTPGTDGERGAGLGLVLCRKYLDMDEGDIGIESEPGHGTVVRFTLRPSPRAAVPEATS